MVNEMEIVRFKQIIDSYGTSVSHWPEAEKDAALRLIVKNGDARGYTEDAALLDQVLLLLPDVEPSQQFMHSILEIAEPKRSTIPLMEAIRTTLWPFGPIWRPASVLAVALTLGLFGGMLFDPYGMIGLNAAEVGEEELAALTFGPEFDLEDLE